MAECRLSFSVLSSLNHHQGNLPSCSCLVLSVSGYQLASQHIEPLVLLAGCNRGFCLKRLLPNLHRDLWMGKQIVIPIGVGGRARFGGKGNQTFTIWYIGQWNETWLTAFCSYCREQKQVFVGEPPTNLASIRAKLFNDLTIPVVLIRRGFFSSSFSERRQTFLDRLVAFQALFQADSLRKR